MKDMACVDGSVAELALKKAAKLAHPTLQHSMRQNGAVVSVVFSSAAMLWIV